MSELTNAMSIDDRPVFRIDNPDVQGDILLVCEHASPWIPVEFDNLGLEPQALTDHVAWDPGAYDTGLAMARALDATMMSGTVSRLVYDLNRPPEAESAMIPMSHPFTIPGNQELNEDAKTARINKIYRPWEAKLKELLDARPRVLITMHSFVPVYRGITRSVEIGFLHDKDARLADAVLGVATGYDIRRNDPYGPDDGVTHTQRTHALPRGLLNLMIEVRSDLIATPEDCNDMGTRLSNWVTQALTNIREKAE